MGYDPSLGPPTGRILNRQATLTPGNQAWLAGQFPMEFDDVPINTSENTICRGFIVAYYS